MTELSKVLIYDYSGISIRIILLQVFFSVVVADALFLRTVVFGFTLDPRVM